MSSRPLRSLSLGDLSPVRLWTSLDRETRALAARCLYGRDWGDAGPRREADFAIARTLRFREAAIRQMPIEKRVDYLVRMVRPDDSLVSSLLLGLHLEARRPMLCSFLDALGLPHQGGLIDEAHDLTPIPADRLAPAVASLFETFPREEVEVYLATLLAMDPETWAELEAILGNRAEGPEVAGL